MTDALAKKTDASLQRIESVDFQMDMFKRLNLSPLMCETHRFEPRPGGKFALVKRDKPVRLFDSNGSASLSTATTADRIGLNKGRGKYNDENRLFDQDSASLKVGEVAAWSTI